MLRILLLLLPLLAGQALAAPDSILQRPIELETGSGTLHGSLLLPKRDIPIPVVLLIAGSGPTDRDGNNPIGGRNDSLKKLAQLLAGQGIASVRYDKRGVAASQAAGTDERALSVERYTADIVAWGQKLKQDPRFSRLILIGHSEGALLASLAAEAAGADALVSLAGSARPIDQLLYAQLRARLRPDLLAQSERVLTSLRNGQTVNDVPPPLAALFRPSVQPYLISLFRQDPAAAFARLRIPALIVQGSHDIQVSLDDAQRLQAAKPDAQLAVIDGMNHMLRIVPMDMARQLASYREPRLPLAQKLGASIIHFIKSDSTSSNAGIGR